MRLSEPSKMIPNNVQLALALLELWYDSSLNLLKPDKGFVLMMKTKGLIAHDRTLIGPILE